MGARWMGLWAVACGGLPYEDAELVVEPGDPPTFAWNGTPVHGLSVGECQGPCSCEEGVPVFDSTTTRWEVGYPQDLSPARIAASEAFVRSPVVYGEPVEGDGLDMEPLPLEAGKTYVVSLSRLAPSEGTGSSAVEDVAGCAVFTE